METTTLTKERIAAYLEKGKRFDNRELLSYRDIKIETGISKNSEGSARVKIGKTEVIVGVKLDVLEPYPDSPDGGVLITTTELTPLSSDRFEYGPPRENAIELARLVDRGVRESGLIDFKKLCIKEGEKVWGIFLDIYSVNDDGNLIDAACIGAIAALFDAKMPEYDEEKERVNYGKLTKKTLPLTDIIPITMTFHKINGKIILDPIREEEDASEARITLAISLYNKKKVVNAMQKGQETALTIEEAEKIFDIAFEKYDELSSKVLKNIKTK